MTRRETTHRAAAVRGPGGALRPDALPEGLGPLHAADPLLAALTARFGPPREFRRPPGFSTLARIVLEQGVSLASAAAVQERLTRRMGGLEPSHFARAGAAAVRAAGAPEAKARLLVRLAGRARSGELDLEELARESDAEVERALCTERGIGPWTAQVYLLTALRRPDVWPDGDRALQRELARDGVQGRAARLERSARWAPHRSLAAFVLWHAHLSRRATARGTARRR